MSAMYGVQSKAGDACFLARENRVIHAPSHPGQWSTWPQRLQTDEGESASKDKKLQPQNMQNRYKNDDNFVGGGGCGSVRDTPTATNSVDLSNTSSTSRKGYHRCAWLY